MPFLIFCFFLAPFGFPFCAFFHCCFLGLAFLGFCGCFFPYFFLFRPPLFRLYDCCLSAEFSSHFLESSLSHGKVALVVARKKVSHRVSSASSDGGFMTNFKIVAWNLFPTNLTNPLVFFINCFPLELGYILSFSLSQEIRVYKLPYYLNHHQFFVLMKV